MSIYQGLCVSFKQEILQAIHDLEGDDIKIALYEDDAELSSNTTAYTATGEVSGSGYTAGGQSFSSNPVLNVVGQSVEVTFPDISWSAELTARGALIYNADKANRAIIVLNFGIDRSSQNGVFTVTMPDLGSSYPVLKLP